jgi:hypothetical protein
MDDRYLWDRGGPPDPEIERLEKELGRFRHVPAPLRFPARRSRRSAVPLLAAAVVLLAAAGVLRFALSGRAVWRVRSIEGAPLVESRSFAGDAPLAVGQRIETDAASRAKLSLGGIAEIEISQDSRLRLVRSGAAEQRLALDRGRISAKISAPPRLFSVETPSALAVDLGCSYTLEVDRSGAGTLRVETGWVSFERGARESVVPAGAACAMRGEQGPGTPYYEDASSVLKEALERFDFRGPSPGDLTSILAAARKRDGLTLWHLLSRAGGPDRERVYERLARLVPPPGKVTRAGILSGDERMLDRWRWELEGMPLLPREGTFASFWRRVWFRVRS